MYDVYYDEDGTRHSTPPEQRRTPLTVAGLTTPAKYTPPGSLGPLNSYNTANVNQPTAAGQGLAGSLGLSDTGQRVGAGAAGEQQTMSGGQKMAVANAIGSIGSAIQSGFQQQAQNARDAAKNIANIKSAIPGPDEFKRDEQIQLRPNQYV